MCPCSRNAPIIAIYKFVILFQNIEKRKHWIFWLAADVCCGTMPNACLLGLLPAQHNLLVRQLCNGKPLLQFFLIVFSVFNAFKQIQFETNIFVVQIEGEPVESKAQTYHWQVGSGRRTARRQGRAGQDGLRQNLLLRGQRSFVPSRKSEKHVLNVSPETLLREIPYEAVEDSNPTMTSSLPSLW